MTSISFLSDVTDPVSWDEQGQPYSARFDDIYHTSSGAVRQADHVFLKGCGLPQGWQAKDEFTILETGFGLGLNFLTTWLRWQQDPKRCECLHFVSLEAYPVKALDIAQALQAFPELAKAGAKLVDVYPELMGTSGRVVQQAQFVNETGGGKVVLTLALGDARMVLPQLQLEADAVFLDGFSPAKNPELWGADICYELGRLAKPGARIATWCVASQVRQRLSGAGFSVQKVMGLPPKRNSLVGVYK